MLHDRDALADVVRAVALHGGALAVGESAGLDDIEPIREIIELRPYIGETVDAGDDVRGILAEAVQDDAERLPAGGVRRAGDADRAFRGCEGLVPRQEAEALRLVAQEHGAQIAVAEAHLALFRDGTGHRESLQADADLFGGLRGGFHAGLQADGAAERISPDGVVECDLLHAADDFFRIHAFGKAQFARFLQAAEAILGKTLLDFGHSSFFSFKRDVVSHIRLSSSDSLILHAGLCTSPRCRNVRTCRCFSCRLRQG